MTSALVSHHDLPLPKSMKVGLQAALSDAQLDAGQAVSQRQLSLSISAIATPAAAALPLNLCLILDHSGSMQGQPLDFVKQAALQIIERLSPRDRLSVIAFDHKAKVLVPNQPVGDLTSLREQIDGLYADGGTAIDEGLRLGIEELAKSRGDCVSQAFLLTDGENEHGDNDRCLKLAQLATSYNLTLNTLGFGHHWNQDVLERIADAGGGALAYIERLDAVLPAFANLFNRIQTVGLTNAHLLLTLAEGVRLAELKPIAQVAPDTIELTPQAGPESIAVRLGDLMVSVPRVVLANLYIHQLPLGRQPIAQVRVRYDDPATGQNQVLSEPLSVEATVVTDYQPSIDPAVQPHILALAKYRQTQIAEDRLRQGDRTGAATMLQSAAQTALQMGDRTGATVLQVNATRLQSGEDLSEADRKKTRIVSKTILQP